MEVWKDIPGFEGYYQASTEGRIRSVAREVACYGKGGAHNVSAHILKPYATKRGYLMVVLSCDGERSKALVHRLVAQTFIDNPDGLTDVNHKNLNKADNRAKNLEWVTRCENMQHAHDNGAFPPEKHRKTLKCVPVGLTFESSYQAAEWVNAQQMQYSGNVKNIASNIRTAVHKGRKAYGFLWVHVESEPSTTIPKGSTPKRVEMGGPS